MIGEYHNPCQIIFHSKEYFICIQKINEIKRNDSATQTQFIMKIISLLQSLAIFQSQLQVNLQGSQSRPLLALTLIASFLKIFNSNQYKSNQIIFIIDIKLIIHVRISQTGQP
ncbi:hypothetical protein pb186bvf_007963 [Paramecium bursaria]